MQPRNSDNHREHKGSTGDTQQHLLGLSLFYRRDLCASVVEVLFVALFALVGHNGDKLNGGNSCWEDRLRWNAQENSMKRA